MLTGAGLSTDSGIPDYRGPGSPAGTPMTYQEFVSGPDARQRYWARGHLGWGRMGRRRAQRRPPRAGPARRRDLLITQNVDGLHERAGPPRLVALHGRIADVVCLDCRTTSASVALQQRLDELNPGCAERHADVADRPDGDVELDDIAGFGSPGCERCGGVLKPDVVFFGENVPPAAGRSAATPPSTRSRDARRAAGRRLVPHRDERLPVRPAGGQGRARPS